MNMQRNIGAQDIRTTMVTYGKSAQDDFLRQAFGNQKFAHSECYFRSVLPSAIYLNEYCIREFASILYPSKEKYRDRQKGTTRMGTGYIPIFKHAQYAMNG